MKKEEFIKVTPKSGNPVVVPASNAEYHEKQGSKVEEATDEDVAVFFPATKNEELKVESVKTKNEKEKEALETELQTLISQKENLEREKEALFAELEQAKAEKDQLFAEFDARKLENGTPKPVVEAPKAEKGK